MNRQRVALVTAAAAVLFVGCGTASEAGAEAAGSGQADYGATKQMVVDILHSSEGKSAIEQILQDPATRPTPVSQAEISRAVEQALGGAQGKQLFQEGAKDPQFATAIAKAIQPELAQTVKTLMKDPEYQKDMLVLLRSPEFSDQLKTLLQTPAYRSQLMQVTLDALQTPAFQAKFDASLKQAVASALPAAAQKQSGQDKGGQSGDQSGDKQDSKGDSDGGEGDD